MQRYAQGLEVPKQQIDYFDGKTSSAIGEIVLDLTYVPKALKKIIVGVGTGLAGVPRFYNKNAVTGKQLQIFAGKLTYMKPASPIGNANSGGAGADPHSHTLTLNTDDADHATANNELQGTITVSYEVA